MDKKDILIKIIDDPSCSWVEGKEEYCMYCPFGGDKSCVNYMITRYGNSHDETYAKAAKKKILDIAIDEAFFDEPVDEK